MFCTAVCIALKQSPLIRHFMVKFCGVALVAFSHAGIETIALLTAVKRSLSQMPDRTVKPVQASAAVSMTVDGVNFMTRLLARG